MGRKKSVDKTIDLEAEVLKAAQNSKNSEPKKSANSEQENWVENLGTPVLTSTPKIKTRKKRIDKIRSKKYTQILSSLDRSRHYGLKEAIELCQKNSFSKFNGSLELHLTLGLDIKDEGQKIRTGVSLPKGLGKKITVIAFVDENKSAACLKAGADYIGSEKTIEEILNKERPINFQKVVASPEFMPKLSKIAKILGPKGLMPSPKNGTVSAEPERAISELKKGRLEIKIDPQAPVVHLALGKLSFSREDLSENFESVIKAIKEAKPPKAQANFLASAYLCPTMGPSFKLDLTPYN